MALAALDPGAARRPREAAATTQFDKRDRSGLSVGGCRSGAVERNCFLLYVNTPRFCSLKRPISFVRRMVF